MKLKGSGQLSRLLTIQQASNATDAEGSPQEVWTNTGSVWAQVRPLTSRETLIAAQAGVQLTHVVTIPYRGDVTARTRLLEGSRVFDIVSQPIDVEERHIELELMCMELVPA